jgi:hypothetical protein
MFVCFMSQKNVVIKICSVYWARMFIVITTVRGNSLWSRDCEYMGQKVENVLESMDG